MLEKSANNLSPNSHTASLDKVIAVLSALNNLITDNKEPMRKWFKREFLKDEGKFALKVNWKNK